MRADHPKGVVAIGASAGGLRPLRAFFRSLPPNTGASFVVVQHLAPKEPSLTPELLKSDTEMPRRPIEDGMPLETDTILFLPPGASLTLDDGKLHLHKGEDREPTRTVIDTFLRSLAEEMGPTAIGILLSGTGSDGTRGLRAVKDSGGVTMVQDPASAEFDGMPLSALRAGIVDYRGDPAELAERVCELLQSQTEGSSPDAASEISEPVLGRIAEILRRRTGHDFGDYKRGTLTRRVRRRMLLAGTEDANEYAGTLFGDAAEVEALSRDLMIGVTEFFRNPEAWEEFSQRVVPQLFANSEKESAVRAWVLGCATGEEAYSLAIALDEHASTLADPPEVTIFATDMNEAGLSFAREGLYPAGIAEQLTPQRLERYFSPEDEHYRVNKRVRERIVFAAHNVLFDPPFSRQDLITCRNLLIYLEPRAQEKVLRVLAYALEPSGYLFLGTAENLATHAELFDAVDPEHRLFQRNQIGGPLPIPSARGLNTLRPPPRKLARRADAPAAAPQVDFRRTLERMLLDGYGPAAALISPQDEVLELFGPTRNYFEPSAARGSSRIIDMALPGLQRPLRSAIQEARQSRAPARRPSVRMVAEGRMRAIDLTVRPAPRTDAAKGLLLVIVQESVVPEIDEGSVPEEEPESSTADLEQELRETRSRLQTTIEELESANEELQSTNEELLSVNEELQTSTEEALSINEELNTVNAELNQKVEELDRTHADLQNLFRSTGIPTVFLDKERNIQRFTPTAARLFSIRPSDRGRPIDDLTHRFVDGHLGEMIDQVLETLEPLESEVVVEDERAWYTLRIAPYRTLDDTIEGVVLTFTDVTRIKLSEQRLDAARRYAEGVIETVHDPLVVLDAKLRVASCNQAFLEIAGRREADVVGRAFSELADWGKGADPLIRRLTEVLPEHETFDGIEVEVDVPGEGRRVFDFSGRGLSTEQEEDERILVIARDVTSRVERELRQAAEARNQDWFLAMLGHELRNPLATVRNCVATLDEGGLEEDRRKHLLAMATRQIGHITRLIKDLLDISRIRGGQLSLEETPFDLAVLVREVVEDQHEPLDEGELEVRVDVFADGLPYYGDRHRIAQAIGNLLDNARSYTPAGGSIWVSAHEADEVIEVVVEDTGIGMGADLLSEVFEPFRRGGAESPLSDPGLGVGLALVRAIAEAHGGNVQGESAGVGEGSRFVLRLPIRTPATDASEPAPVPPADEPIPPKKVLIVEDNPFAAETTAIVLEQAGHTVEIVSDGSAALERIQADRPDVVLCDLGLPGGMSGYDLARRLRGEPDTAGIRLVALTGYGQERDRRRARKAGFDEFLVKPVATTTLRANIAARQPASPDDGPGTEGGGRDDP